MIAADLAWAAANTGGTLPNGGAHTRFSGVSTDSRSLQAGNLFIALKGPRFDGHRFVDSAFERGAAAAVVSNDGRSERPCVCVEDTQAALTAIGRAWRSRFEGPVLALTGSNGKTTVKEAIAAILREHGPALATRGNLNNEIGVPLMLCELDRAHWAAVLELGSNHPGEIARLTRLVEADIGLLTNADAAHLEGFGSVEAVARANGELVAELPPDATVILPVDDPWFESWSGLAGERRCIRFGRSPQADVRIVSEEPFELTLAGRRLAVDWPLIGWHNRTNAAGAAAAAFALGLEPEVIAAGLARMQPVAGRLCRRTGPRGSAILDDSYNANPGSFAVALDVLERMQGRRWAVMGEMSELGESRLEAHRQLGERARRSGIERLWVCGASREAVCTAFGDGARSVTDLETLTEALREELTADSVLLVKGSRSNGLERLVEALAGDRQGARHAV